MWRLAKTCTCGGWIISMVQNISILNSKNPGWLVYSNSSQIPLPLAFLSFCITCTVMEGNDGAFNSYYHTTTSSANNGIFVSPNSNPNTNASSSTLYSDGNPLGFSHSMPSRAALPEVVRRKRGRPRKYGPGTEPSPPSAKSPAATALPSAPSSAAAPKKKEPSSARKAQMVALGNAGQGFTPHVITVSAGEDVSQKIMSFMQQHKRAVCILSANGSISTATLRQPAVLGGSVTYEGRFEILSLSGSFLHSEVGGSPSRTGGLSVCLSGADGRIIGGGVGGPLMAACPVQVITGSFLSDGKKDSSDIGKGDASAGKLPSSPMGGTVVSPINFRSTPDSSVKNSVRGNEDHRNTGGSGFVLQPRTLHGIPSRLTDWRSQIESDARSDAGINLTGRMDEVHSPEDGDD